jgi:type IV pilus assembly protein PilY1
MSRSVDPLNDTNCRDASEPSTTGYNYMYPNRTYLYNVDFLGGPEYYTADVKWCEGFSGSGTTAITPKDETKCGKTMNKDRKTPIYSNMKVARVVPTNNSYPKAATRTDCAGTDCTYLEEMQNFANWFVWYRMRGNMLKSAMTLAFKDVRGQPATDDEDDLNYLHARVGFMTIHSFSDTTEHPVGSAYAYLQLRDFEGAQRTNFYDHVIGARTDEGGTPLRRSLSWIGRLYAGRQTISNTHPDPVLYSCRRNYSITFTDGAWNDEDGRNLRDNIIYGQPRTNNESGNPDYGVACSTANTATDTSNPPACIRVNGRPTDNASTNLMTPRCNEDTSKVVECKSTGALGGCPPATRPECDVYQSSLSADNQGSLADVAYYYYHTDLRKDDTGKDRPGFEKKNVPPTGSDPTMDDVAPWVHMTTFTVGLGMDGNLEYRFDYKTAKEGDFWEIRNGSKNWSRPPSAGGYFEDIHSLPKADDLWHAAVNGRGKYFSAQNPQELVDSLTDMLTTIAAASASGTAAAVSNPYPVDGEDYAYIASYRTVNWDGNVTAYAIDASTGTLGGKAWDAQTQLNHRITGDCGDNIGRDIYFAKTNSTTLEEFRWENLDSTQKGYFNGNTLTQFKPGAIPDLSAYGSLAGGENLVNYLRGESKYENKTQPGCPAALPLYRARENVLGDIVHSSPVYIGKAIYNYKEETNAGYTAFKDGTAGRQKMIYVGANDGMVHAFNADNGREEWAFIPPQVMPTLSKLADKKYSVGHQYYVDGPIATGDILTGGGWKTIIVGGLGKGGRGIYALDVSGAGGKPTLLWAIDHTKPNFNNLGYTYGKPRITKLSNGTWVVLVASGYNNINPGDGGGHVFVINAATGAWIRTINTGSGNTINPSGLATLDGYVPTLMENNARDPNDTKHIAHIYGGDLNGDLWRFNIENGAFSKIIGLGSGQPITVPPLVAKMGEHPVLFFGTGQYLGPEDIRLPQTGRRIYAIKDTGSGTLNTNGLVDITTGAPKTINWSSDSGWFYRLNDKQQVAIPATMYGSLLIVATVEPTATVECAEGGKGYLYIFNAATGLSPDGSPVTGTLYEKPITGLTLIQTLSGTGQLIVGDGTNQCEGADCERKNKDLDPPPGSGGHSGARVIWQELNTN